MQLIQRVCEHVSGLDQLLRFAVVSKRIPFKRKERELIEFAVALQILKEPPEPSGFAKLNSSRDLRPLDVLEAGPAELKRRIDFMNGFRKLEIQSREVLRRYELPVWLFTDFDSLDGIAASFQISNLSSGVLRSVVEHRHGK